MRSSCWSCESTRTLRTVDHSARRPSPAGSTPAPRHAAISAAHAQHWAAELVNRFESDRPGLAALALTTDTCALTAIGNDHGYALTFSRQLEALGRRGDVPVALSTSGRSPNVLRAVEAVTRLGIVTVGFTGRSGGDLVGRCDPLIRIPSDRTPSIQEGHEVFGHLLCEIIERQMFPP